MSSKTISPQSAILLGLFRYGEEDGFILSYDVFDGWEARYPWDPKVGRLKLAIETDRTLAKLARSGLLIKKPPRGGDGVAANFARYALSARGRVFAAKLAARTTSSNVSL